MSTVTTTTDQLGGDPSPTEQQTLDAELRRRLFPLLLSAFLVSVGFWVPVEKLFMNEIGFDPASVGLMAAAYAAVVPLLEIPSGILADRWSRRGVLMLAYAALLVSVTIGGLSTSVLVYVVGAGFLGVFFAMQSGTMDAVVYDTVLEVTGSSARFERSIGRVRLVESIALVSSALTGGVLASLTSPRLTYVMTLPFMALSIVVLRTFREPRLHQAEEPVSLRQQVATTYRTLLRRGCLLPLVTVMVLAGLLTNVIFEFGPLWMVAIAAPAVLYGPHWAGLTSAFGLGGLLAGRFRFEAPATVGTIVTLLVGSSVALVFSHNTGVIIAAQVILALLVVTTSIFLTARLHDAIPSNIRSGVASGVGTFTWMAFLPFSLIFGQVSKHAGVHTAGWMIVAVTLLAAGLLVKLALRPQPAADEDPATATGAADRTSTGVLSCVAALT
jgi:MFS family permease